MFKNDKVCFLLTGISASGKTSIIYNFLEKRKDLGIEKVITSTSRPMRPGEQDGVDYYFYSKEEILRMRDSEEFLESEDVYGNIYGSEKKELDRIIKNNHTPFFVCDVKGAKTFIKEIKNIISIYVLPDSFSHLKSRIENRPGSTEETTKKRLKEALNELDFINTCSYVIINREGELGEAVSDLENIVTSHLEKNRPIDNNHLKEVKDVVSDITLNIRNYTK